MGMYSEDPDANEIELYINVQRPKVWRDNPGPLFAPIKPLQL